MECTDHQIPPRHGILPVRDKEQRQHFVENLERQEHNNNAHPQRHHSQRHGAHCCNCQIQARQDSSRGRVWPKHVVEFRKHRAQVEPDREADTTGNKHIHDE
jgi:hypothetical protein